MLKQFISKKNLLIWLFQFIVVVCLLVSSQLNSPLKINADLTAMFNSQQGSNNDSSLNNITHKIEQQNLNQQIILVGANSLELAINKADNLTDQLNNLPSVKHAKTRFDELPNFEDIIVEQRPYKQLLLSDTLRQLLQQGDPEKIFNYQFSLLNQLADQSVALTLEQDPTLSLADFFSRPLLANSSLQLNQQHLVTQYQKKYYVFITFTNQGSSINIDAAQQLTQQLEQLTQSDEVEYLYTGAIFYASKASKSGQYEMMLYGGISLIATLLLIIFVYRNTMALIATLALIGISFVYGYLALSLFYQQINVITLVFSVTLIGIAADYSFHALTELKFGQIESNNAKPLASIFSSLLMSYITTGAGYGLLLLAPFVLFQQIALFTLFGLFGALLTVLLFYPFLLTQIRSVKSQQTQVYLPAYIAKLNRFQQALVKFIVTHKFIALFVLLASLISLTRIQFNDDIRHYYSADQQLKTNETKVKSILKTKWDLQYFLVQAKTEQSLLEAEEALLDRLNPLIEQAELTKISAISQWLPSIKKQNENYQLIKQIQASGKFAQMQSILTDSNWDINNKPKLLLPQNWLNSYLGKMYQQQWIEDSTNFYSIVRLAGINNLATLTEVAKEFEQVHFIDKVQTISNQLDQFRQHLIWVLIAAVFAAFLVFIWRYGLSVAWIALLTPVFALIIALTLSYFIQQYLNIFNLVAGILILALGLDYSVFYAEHGFEKKITLTTLMSALSSIFVFAILMLSSMPAIKSFGLTVFIGVLLTFVLSPLATINKQETS